MTDDVPVLSTPSASNRLSPNDVPVGEPLEWSIASVDGALLFEAGTTVPNQAARSFLFENFEPYKFEAAGADSVNDSTQTALPNAGSPEDESSGPLTLDNIGLKIGARLGLRAAAGSAMYSSRVIGFSTPGARRARAVFITQPVISGHQPLNLARGERVELVALAARSVFQFACTVDAVCHEPFHYLVLSEPGNIRRLRARKFVRMTTRMPAHFFNASSEERALQLGLIRDLSPFGMSLAVAEPNARLDDRLRLSFRFNTDDTDVNIDCDAIVRHVQELDAQGTNGAYGLEFVKLESSERIALKSLMAEQI
ncbi:flagellar brake protein [Burkholderia sp. S171]|uniref:flagellar brake protein n=1 Tax=Burkholderia sp. S171 TaxID=1641860 RepID=UPI00131B62B9|nr:flagellar brake protein [Burkholderia sp. S171]